MRTFFVVILDSNSQNVAAFFLVQADAIAWRDANHPSGEVFEARIDGYERVGITTIDF